MDEREADERYDRLVAHVTSVQQTLTGEQHWAAWFDSARRQLLAYDGNALAHVLAAYGGMGSFNDMSLAVETERTRSQIYDDAAALLKDLHR